MWVPYQVFHSIGNVFILKHQYDWLLHIKITCYALFPKQYNQWVGGMEGINELHIMSSQQRILSLKIGDFIYWDTIQLTLQWVYQVIFLVAHKLF